MFNFFKKPNVSVKVIDTIIEKKQKTTNEIIEEIHESFYTEVDRLLASAKIAKSLDTNKQDLIDKCARLKALGFTNTKEVKEAEAELKRISELKLENAKNSLLVDTINYFNFKYPQYKFITEDSVKKICAKYNLVYGEISKYMGTVPDKNLKQIEDFKIDDNDNCGLKTTIPNWDRQNIKKEYVSREQIEYYLFEKEKRKRAFDYMNYSTENIKHEVAPIEIAAPLKDFNMIDMEVKNFQLSKIEIPDPVVLKPVFHNGQKHYLIVTAWGLEASDELVVNQKMN